MNLPEMSELKLDILQVSSDEKERGVFVTLCFISIEK